MGIENGPELATAVALDASVGEGRNSGADSLHPISGDIGRGVLQLVKRDDLRQAVADTILGTSVEVTVIQPEIGGSNA